MPWMHSTAMAVANEVMDICEGHPASRGRYHYHHDSPCFRQGAEDEHSPLAGYALDGFGIYGPREVGGVLIINDALDECHGHLGPVPAEDGSTIEVYHYHINNEFPYTIGCFRGIVDLPAPRPASQGGNSLPTATPEPEVDGIDLTRLPIGDGRVSAGPERGSVWSCTSDFRSGRVHTGPWFNDDETFDLTIKPVVDGQVIWPHMFEVLLEGDVRVIVGNSLPDHPTGEFPIGPERDVYQYATNPNSITARQLRVEVPAMPTQSNAPSCLRLGEIGVLLTGGLLFNPLDAIGLDAVAHETRDACGGHPQGAGKYHYHGLTPCLEDQGEGHSSLVGYAFDGFGIYGYRGEDGRAITNADLDECHGHTHEVIWDDQATDLYHYHATWEYPYAVGCYRGNPAHIAPDRR